MKLPPATLAFLWVGISFSVPPTQAHEEFEITSTARLQHQRLEVSAIMSLRAGGALLRESSDPEFELRPENFERYRGQMQTAAMSFFLIEDGRETLRPLQASVVLPEPGHLRVTVIYPRPASWPLKFRPGNIGHLPGSAVNDLEVYDQEEKLMGTTAMLMRDFTAPGLSVTPAAQTSPAASLAPVPPAPALPDQPPVAPANAAPAPPPLSWAGVALGLTLGLTALVLVVLVKKGRTAPSL